MFGVIQKCFLYNVFCVLMNNQEYRAIRERVNFNSNEPLFHP